MSDRTRSLNNRRIFIFWLPLAATWLMMAVEGPFLAAVIARLAEPKYNLAAYGVAYSFALIVEAPIIMIMSAATALVKDGDSYLKLRNFTYFLNGTITALMLVLLIPPVFYFITERLIGLPAEVARLTHWATILLIPWPGAIGYRRFYQGVLIRSNLTRRVAYGTIIRLTAMSTTAVILYNFSEISGAMVGGAALAMGVTSEAIASKTMARSPVKYLLSSGESEASGTSQLSYRYIFKFYYPLALTSIIALGVQPMITFFVGQSRLAIESLAVLPVIISLVFIFRSLGLSFQEAGIALMGEKYEGYVPLRNFAALLGVAVIGGLSLLAFTPLAVTWFHTISGLSMDLTHIAILPARIMAIMPGLTVLLSFQRSVLVNSKNTSPITLATIIEVAGIFTVLFISIKFLNLIGAVAAALAFVAGRFAANGYLFRPYFSALKKTVSQSMPKTVEEIPDRI
ncbi:MAG: hypothetical protein P8184_04195, partial [Calditrichia bacterium]